MSTTTVRIKINNKKTTQDYRVKTGDVISIAAFIINDFSENQSELKNNLQKNEKNTFQKDLEIVFQNEDILILNKPYDVLVHGSDNSLDKQVENYYKKINQNKSNCHLLQGLYTDLIEKQQDCFLFH